MARENKAAKLGRERVTEQYILTQVNYHYDNEGFRDWKDRMESGDSLYKGQLNALFPDENALPEISLVENKFKNALHDISRLASEGKGSVKFIQEGDKDIDLKRTLVRESINEGYWGFNHMQRQERQLYLDLAGSGMMAACAYYDGRSPYPQIQRLNPRFTYPDVRNGKLQNMLYVEVVLERVLAHQFPHLGLNDAPDNNKDGLFCSYYDDQEVVEAVLLTNEKSAYAMPTITNRWDHRLGVVPVAFEMLDTYDGAFHGLFEQLAGPLMVRNKTVRFMVDYLESISHSPLVAKNVINPDDEPGPMTVYQLDPNVDNASLSRLPPAAPSGTVFGLLQYMQDQEEKESIQPPSRSGNVSQSIASGSFVDRTQGQLTSVIKEAQDKMGSFREQMNEVCMRIDEEFMNATKPLYRPVAGKKTYTPTEDIKGWYFHEVKFGAGAGLDRLNADTRVLNHLSARLISRQEARSEIDYLDDSASSQDKIDRENLQDVIFQRLVSDPATPLPMIAPLLLSMQEGLSLTEALQKHLPELLQGMKEQQQQGAPLPAPPGEQPVEGAPEGPTPATQELLDIQQQGPPIAQLFPGRNYT